MRTEGSDKPIECTSKTKRPKLENESSGMTNSLFDGLTYPYLFPQNYGPCKISARIIC